MTECTEIVKFVSSHQRSRCQVILFKTVDKFRYIQRTKWSSIDFLVIIAILNAWIEAFSKQRRAVFEGFEAPTQSTKSDILVLRESEELSL